MKNATVFFRDRDRAAEKAHEFNFELSFPLPDGAAHEDPVLRVLFVGKSLRWQALVDAGNGLLEPRLQSHPVTGGLKLADLVFPNFLFSLQFIRLDTRTERRLDGRNKLLIFHARHAPGGFGNPFHSEIRVWATSL